MKSTPLKRVWLSLGFLFFLACFGTAGYVLIEGWAVGDALYMTIITISTVGFGEVAELTPAGQRFTILLILLGIATVGYGLSNLAAFIVEGEFSVLFRWRRMARDIANLRDHIIICGYGDEGQHAGEELARSRVPFLVVERAPELCARLSEEGHLVVHGDATEDEVLERAGVRRARGLIAALPGDADNVFVTLTARGINPKLHIIARANDDASAAKLYRAGADHVISSAKIGGRRMASALLRPKVVNFLDVIMRDHELALRLEEVDIDEGSALAGKSIRDLHIRGRTGALVVGYQAPGQAVVINPPAETVLKPGDVLIVMGTEAQLEKLLELAGVH